MLHLILLRNIQQFISDIFRALNLLKILFNVYCNVKWEMQTLSIEHVRLDCRRGLTYCIVALT